MSDDLHRDRAAKPGEKGATGASPEASRPPVAGTEAAAGSALLTDFERYARLIEASIASPQDFVASAESATEVQVERGIVLAHAVGNLPPAAAAERDSSLVGRLIELAPSQHIGQIAFVDRAGHHRPLYRPLTLYAWLSAYRVRFETLAPQEFGRWDEALRLWCDLLEGELEAIAINPDGNPAARGASVAESAWTALALHVAGKVFVRDAWTDLASDLFGRLSRGQRESGAFLAATASDNPEPLWYHELAILHATASFAVQAEDRGVARAVARSAAYLFEEVQPDHATEQPWAIFPFVWAGATRPMADQLLHAAALRRGGSPPDGVSLILLADALYCLRLFL